MWYKSSYRDSVESGVITGHLFLAICVLFFLALKLTISIRCISSQARSSELNFAIYFYKNTIFKEITKQTTEIPFTDKPLTIPCSS